jgi:hypothetical protein
MRILDQLSAFVAAADGGEWLWGAGSRGVWGRRGARAEEMNLGVLQARKVTQSMISV